MKGKVGIVSCYFKHNYGSMLQAYATQKVLDNMNIDNETINIDNNLDFKNGKRKYYLNQIFNFPFIKSKFGMIKLKFDKRLNKTLGENISIRDKKYDEFKKNFNLTKPYKTYKELTKICENYDSVIVGSDQLWLPVNVVADYYTLNFVPEEINKISYSTSFGVSNIPNKYKEKYRQFLNRIDSLSVRENTGVDIIKKFTDKKVEVVCDPTLLLDKKCWMKIESKERIIKDKYILCYFLGKNIEHRKFAEKLKKETGFKIVSLNHADEYVKYSDKFADITPYDIGPSEFLNLIHNAEYVCTDSFHGTIFSLIYNKKFFTFRRYKSSSLMSTNSRVYSLLEIVGLRNRLLSGEEYIKDIINEDIDFDKVNKRIEKFRSESLEFLKNALNHKNKLSFKDKTKCCGCSACFSVCPKKCISMVRDDEGFLYPKIDKSKCINCGLCKKVCPIVNACENKKEKHTYIFQYNDDKVRRESTSGGAFTAIADAVIDKGGVVYGVAFDDNFKVIHICVSKKEELYKFRNSKYVQSDPKNTFREIKEKLDKGILVCYSGTACQIEGLKKFLMRDYDNLILVDVVCRAVPSPLVWEKYLKLRKKKYKNISRIFFRDKYYGYKYSNLSIYNKNNDKRNEYHSGVESDPYLRAFFSNICDRPSCYDCKFKKDNRESDITIWDCFEVEHFNRKLDDDKGTTRIMTNSLKGDKLIKELSKIHTCEEIDVGNATKNFLAMYKSVKMNNRRDDFFKDLNSLSEEELFNKYFPDTIKVKVERNARKMLLKTGMYKPLLKLGKKIRKRD